PHFLFNALTSLAALTRSDVPRARTMAALLRAFYGKAAAHDERALIPLAEELALVRQYLEIERVRFGSRLLVEMTVDEHCDRTPVPALLLQPLIENAIKHGVAARRGANAIRVSAARDGDVLHLAIRNDADASAAAIGTQTGLRNARERLAYACGPAARLDSAWEDDGSFCVRIAIPVGAAA
ncbi:MAG TPA: histidine kinase, partial [Thermoanaerobaculia bacterium]|nr:histidine kinase [Thermoanaerobaculia bacterium]